MFHCQCSANNNNQIDKAALVLVLVLVLVMVCFRCKRNNYVRGNCILRLPLPSKSHFFQ
jgi:hypothetical protein